VADDEPRRRSRWPRRIAITLVIIVVLLVVADRAGDYVAERKAGDTIETSQHLTSRPDVDIAGFPFLTQAVEGSFDKITVTAKNFVIDPNGAKLMVARLQVVLHRLSVSRSFSSFHADSADATALITYGDLGRALQANVAYAGDGRITASKSVSLAGQTVTPSITATPQLVDGALAFGAATVNGLGSISAAVAAALQAATKQRLSLDGFPLGVRVQKLTADAGGVHLELAGQDLTYSK
jgi:hypothetical protein